MITLNTFGPKFGLPDPSPFCMKAMVLLKMADMPYTLAHPDVRKAPKGKLPTMDDEGVLTPDTTFIRWRLETQYGIDFDKGLDAGQRATAWAFEKLCEDNLYWGMGYDRWIVDENFVKGPRQYFDAVPAPMRSFVANMVRRQVRKNMIGQGMARHSKAEVEKITTHGIDAIAAFLANKPFLMGAEPCGADAIVFSSVAHFLCPVFPGPMQDAAKAHANLTVYRDRGMQRWFSDFRASAA